MEKCTLPKHKQPLYYCVTDFPKATFLLCDINEHISYRFFHSIIFLQTNKFSDFSVTKHNLWNAVILIRFVGMYISFPDKKTLFL